MRRFLCNAADRISSNFGDQVFGNIKFAQMQGIWNEHPAMTAVTFFDRADQRFGAVGQLRSLGRQGGPHPRQHRKRRVERYPRHDDREDAVGLLSENDTTIVISSHHLSDVERITNRIVLVSNGRLILNTELDELYEGHCLATFEHRSTRVEANPDQQPCHQSSPLLQSIPHYVGHRLRNGEVKVVMRCDVGTAKQTLSDLNIAAHVARTNLEDLYVVLVGGNYDNA